MQDTDRVLDMFHKTAAGRKEENVMKRVAPMLQITAALLTFLFSLDSAAQEQSSSAPAGTIVRLDPRFDRLVPRDAVLEKIADGFAWAEGPVWNRKAGYLCLHHTKRAAAPR